MFGTNIQMRSSVCRPELRAFSFPMSDIVVQTESHRADDQLVELMDCVRWHQPCSFRVTVMVGGKWLFPL
jgi:hypothetical protein